MQFLVCLAVLLAFGTDLSRTYTVKRYPRQAVVQSGNVTQAPELASSSTAPTSMPPTVVTSTEPAPVKIACPRPTFCAPLNFCAKEDTVFDAQDNVPQGASFFCGRTKNTIDYVCCRNQKSFPMRWRPTMDQWFVQMTPTTMATEEIQVFPWDGFNTEQLGSLADQMRLFWLPPPSLKTRRQAPATPTTQRLPDRVFFLPADQMAGRFDVPQIPGGQMPQQAQDDRKRRELSGPRRPPLLLPPPPPPPPQREQSLRGPRPQRIFE